ncbi:MAG: hypothetical protein GF383_07980 [Candidatus Lokiarchaeota archaeon]|nr:hypothetical protein [Candidatus Lokiarchaeota archaeon]MBD3340270.1 hypothetical protein [Candidatus Lokiarchaeota archaeon]
MKKSKIFLLILLNGIIFAFLVNSVNFKNNKPNSFEEEIDLNAIKSSDTALQLIQELKPSTYYISPKSSPGENDGVFFTFMANKNGNYTFIVKDAIKTLTRTTHYEFNVDVESPHGSDKWYMVHTSFDPNNATDCRLYFSTSKDKGNSWSSKTIKNFRGEGTNIMEFLFYLFGSNIAVDSVSGVVGTLSLVNYSQIEYLGSTDNGTTWKINNVVGNLTDIGFQMDPGEEDLPTIELAILKNGTLIAISESESSSYTPLVFFQSHDNGTSWSDPSNVTSSGESGLKCKKPKIIVNRTSGDYWLTWVEGDENAILRGYMYNESENPYSFDASIDDIIVDYEGNYDLYYNEDYSQFSVIYNHGAYGKRSELFNYTLIGTWNSMSLGYSEPLASQIDEMINLNYAFDGKFHHFTYADQILEKYEIYKNIHFQNNTFWELKDSFNELDMEQIYWDGSFNKEIPMEDFTVKAELTAQNGTNILEPSRYVIIKIDNEEPEFNTYFQNRYYFNPLHTNLTISNIPWNISSSESCDLILEVHNQNATLSGEKVLTDNVWEDLDPRIFISTSGTLYLLYNTIESGRNIIYLTKSENRGTTWSAPTIVYETTGYIQAFDGSAWEDIVCVYIGLQNQKFLYRSYDQGATFQDPIDLSDNSLFGSDVQEDVSFAFTDNGTLFSVYYSTVPKYSVVRSDDLGFTWKESKTWYVENDLYICPDIVYDRANNLIHVVLPTRNNTLLLANFTFATLNLSSGAGWKDDVYKPNIPMGVFYELSQYSKPQLFITQQNGISSGIIHAIFISDFYSGLVPKYKELISSDNGESWSDASTISFLNNSFVTSYQSDIFYARVLSDGSDTEVYFTRNSSLQRIIRKNVIAEEADEIIFDGKNDLGDFLNDGNYSFNLKLKDQASNEEFKSGWIYVDYSAPSITERSNNWTIDPIPRQNVKIRVKAEDEVSFTIDLIYKKDNGPLITIPMTPVGDDYYEGTIPGDQETSLVQYYVKTVDMAGNVEDLDADGLYFSYDMPMFRWDSEGLFKEKDRYSSGKDYDFEIEITSDNEYVSKVYLKYSFNDDDSWDELELEANSPTYTGTLDDLPGDLRTLYYQVIVVDVFGNEIEFTEEREIEFYPELPSFEAELAQLFLIGIISACVGFMVAFGYITLKNTSHEKIRKELVYKELKQKSAKSIETEDLDEIKEQSKEESQIRVSSQESEKKLLPFMIAYMGIVGVNIAVFGIGLLLAFWAPEVALMMIGTSLLIAVLGYMVLMSRDITNNIYQEKLAFKNVLLEAIQIGFMLVNIITLLMIGYMIDWFRYYLIESTFDFGAVQIPRLYLSVIAVFFTSLVLVAISTLIQLQKTITNIKTQKEQGASESLLLYLKDQNGSRLITRLGYKTIVFLVTVLISIVTTTELITLETGILLAYVVVPFVLAGFLGFFINRVIEKKKIDKRKDEMDLPFIDSTKICNNCGEPMYLSEKYCSHCGKQMVFNEKVGTYVSKWPKCDSLVHEDAKFCPSCGENL